MLHYYFFKYWSRGLIGLMVAFVVGYFSLFSYSLFAENNAEQRASSASAQLSATPPLRQLLPSNTSGQDTYKKSVQLFGEIQKLKDKNQDTSKLESLYAESVKNLTNQHPKEAEVALQKIESEIATINETLNPTPSPSVQPSGVELSGTVTPEPSAVPSGTQTEETAATDSATLE